MVVILDGDFICYYLAHAIQAKGVKLESYTYDKFVSQIFRTLHAFMSNQLGGRPRALWTAFDEGRSWRYDYLSSLQIVYKDRDKTKRELTDFHNYRLAFRNALHEYKLPVLAVDKTEADDSIHIGCSLIEHGEVCILTGDSDMQQELMSTMTKEVFMLNPFLKDGFPILRTIYQPRKDQVEDDFFAESTNTKWVEGTGLAKVIDPYRHLFIKIISGDSSDTIPSAFQYNDGKTTKTVGETRATSYHRDLDPVPTIETIRELLKDREKRIEMARNIMAFAKLKAFEKLPIFEQNLLRNIRCILLDDCVYEEDRLKEVKEQIIKIISQDSPGADMQKIFKNTKYDFSTNYYSA